MEFNQCLIMSLDEELIHERMRDLATWKASILMKTIQPREKIREHKKCITLIINISKKKISRVYIGWRKVRIISERKISIFIDLYLGTLDKCMWKEKEINLEELKNGMNLVLNSNKDLFELNKILN